MKEDEAIIKPVHSRANETSKRRRGLTIDGETHTINEWSIISGVNANTIQTRISRGWEIYDAVYKKIGGKNV